MTKNFTQGSIWKSLLLFALPLLASSLVQQLYNTVDLIFVGREIGKSASSAIGASSLFVTCLVGFFGGMSVGSGIVIAQVFGSGRIDRLKKAIQTAVALSLAGSALLMALGYLLAPGFLTMMRTPGELMESASGYLRIYFISLPAIVTYNICAGALRALGDSRSPLYAQLIGGLLNVALDALFLLAFKGGVIEVAWATVIAQTVAAVIVAHRLTKLDSAYALSLRCIGFDREILGSILKNGIPAGIQSLLITLSNVMAQYHINALGVDAIAAFTNYFKVELIIYLPIVAFGQAIMTFSAQNTGAGNLVRTRRGTRVCLLMSMALAAGSSVLALIFGAQLFGIFTREAEVVALGLKIIAVSFPFYFIYSILQVLGDSMRGSGKTAPPMYIIMFNLCIIRTALLFILVPRFQTIQSVAVTYPVTWALTSLCMAAYYLYFHKRLWSGTPLQKQHAD